MADAVRRANGPAGPATYAALDLGTNNCRLLVARPAPGGFRVVDSFSRIVRLGEGVSRTGRLGDDAIGRTLEALAICADKMRRRGATRMRLVATEACRAADNGGAFLARVAAETGLALELLDRATEARLAAAGSAALADPRADAALMFDIGGGSSELVWLARGAPGARIAERMKVWISMPLGVVTLAEEFGGEDVDEGVYEAMVARVTQALAPFLAAVGGERERARFHHLGTSGTVTTVAGVHLGLQRYERRLVDGVWLDDVAAAAAVMALRRMDYAARRAHGCIGPARADLVLAGCAIYDAIRRAFPAPRLRVADRGLREGILSELMAEDGIDHG